MNWLKRILQRIYAFVFGCVHRHTTWPHRNTAGFDYLRCLDCGAELPYSLQQMRIVTAEERVEGSKQETGVRSTKIRHEPRLALSRKGV
jgi:hypothetical protein